MDLAQLQAQQREGWSLEGDGERSRWFVQIVERLLDFTDIGLGQTVLNVTSSGLTALIAAQRGAHVVAVVPSAEHVAHLQNVLTTAHATNIEIQQGMASALPFPDASFDAILSIFGLQFEPEPAAVVQEIGRVAKPGAVLGLAVWDTDSPVGQFMRLIERFMPLDKKYYEILGWGEADTVDRRLAGYFAELEFKFGNAPLLSPSPEALWDTYLSMDSPIRDAILAMDEEQRELLSIAAVEQFREYTDPRDQVEWPREYILVRGLRTY